MYIEPYSTLHTEQKLCKTDLDCNATHSAKQNFKIFLVFLPVYIIMPNDNTQIDRQTTTKRHCDRKSIHIQAVTVMLLKMHENLENIHIIVKGTSYSKN